MDDDAPYRSGEYADPTEDMSQARRRSAMAGARGREARANWWTGGASRSSANDWPMLS